MKINISDEDIKQAIRKWEEEKERFRWKKDEKHDQFLNYLLELVGRKKGVDTDDFDNNDTPTPIKPNYTGEEFSELLFSLFDLIDDYAKENNISNEFDRQENDYFTQDKYCVKIYDKYYSIKLVVGQGSYVRFETLKEDKVYDYVDYKDIVIN